MITGATDGIGAALVQRYWQFNSTLPDTASKVRLLLVGRRDPSKTHLRQLSGYDYCRVDLAEYDAAERLAKWVASLNIRHIDRLFLNAGGGYVGAFKKQSQLEIRRLLILNLLTPLLILRELAPYLNAKTLVTVVGSTASRLYHHSYALYAASKKALTAAIRSYTAELLAKSESSLAHRLPQIALVHPGPTQSALHRKSGMKSGKIAKLKAAPTEQVARLLQVATAGEQVIGRRNRLLWHLSKWRQFPFSILELLPYRSRQLSAARRRDNPSLLIVGAADGIGAAIAQYYYRQGWNLLLVDRDEQHLTVLVQTLHTLSPKSPNTSGGTIQQIAADIRHPHTLDRIVTEAQRLRKISLFYYTAAISAVAPFLKVDSHIYCNIFEINLLAPALLLQRLLSERLLSRKSRVVWFSSLSHYTSYPGAALYSATKSGLAILAAALNGKYRRERIRYCVVFPGPVRTAHARRYSPSREGRALREAMERRRMPPMQVAQIVARGAARGAQRIMPGWGSKLAALLGFFFPRISRAIMLQLIFRHIEKPLLPPDL